MAWPLHAVLLLATAGGIGLALVAPNLFYGLMQEDAWAEWATFLSFLFAAALSLRLASRSRGLDRAAGVLLLIFTAFVAGEEISWGQRILAFEPPKMFLEHNYQQELNLHNLLKTVMDTRWMITIIGIGYGLVLPALVRLRPLARFAPLAPSLTVAPWFLVVALLEIFYPFDLTGELAELLLGLTFIADLGLRSKDLAPAIAPATQLASLVLSLGITPMVESLVYGDQTANAAAVERELDQLASDLEREGARTKKLFKKRRVHKRVFTAVKARYLRFDAGSAFLEGDPKRTDRRGYFLDIWNQPYWILHRKKDARTILYSFGPNRRRDWDSDRGDPSSERGDDIVVAR